MNQEKIGKFIAQCRKNKNFTQMQLAESLNVSDKTVSKWETGKGMPDSSIMLDLCNKLDINVNELLCGEKLNELDYKERASENIVNIAKEADKNKKNKNIIIRILVIILTIFIIYITAISVWDKMEIEVKYDERIMKCEITNDSIIYNVIGLSIMNMTHKEINTESETLVFITNKIFLQNKVRSHFETWDSMAQLINGEKARFASGFSLEKKDIIDCKEKIKVYYTNISFNKIEKADKKELQRIIENSYLMCQN